MQALAAACHSVSLALRRGSRPLLHHITQISEASKADNSSLEARTLSAFSRVFSAMAEGRRLSVEEIDKLNFLGTPQRDLVVSEGGRIDDSNIELTANSAQDRELAKRDIRLLESTNVIDRLRHHGASDQQTVATDSGADILHTSVLMVTETARADQRATKCSRMTEGHTLTRSKENAAKSRARMRKSIVDFFAETTGIQHTPLEAERSESYAAAARLISEFKKEHRSAEEQSQKPAKASDRGGVSKDKAQRQEASQVGGRGSPHVR